MPLWAERRALVQKGLAFLGLGSGHPAGARAALSGEVAQAAAAPGVPGAILRLDHPDGAQSWVAGRLRLDGGPALRPDTPFHIASLGKLFTATAVMQQVERGQLRLSDPVSAILGPHWLAGLVVIDGRDRARDITIAHLLAHQSGLPMLEAAPGFHAAVLGAPDRIWSPAELIAAARGLPPAGLPGEKSAYSSTNYHLLGLVLEQITGRRYDQVIRAELLDPLELGATYHSQREWPGAEADHPPAMHHYAGGIDLSQHHPSFEFADGGFVSSAADMTRFARALAQGAPFARQETWAQMLTGGESDGGPDKFYQGLGPMVERRGGRLRRALHGGFWGLGLRLAADGSWAALAALGQSETDPWPLLDRAEATLDKGETP